MLLTSDSCVTKLGGRLKRKCFAKPLTLITLKSLKFKMQGNQATTLFIVDTVVGFLHHTWAKAVLEYRLAGLHWTTAVP